MTNLDWIVDHDLLHRATGAEHVAILNDMQAQGHSVGHVASSNVRPISISTQTTPQKGATSLVVNVGTGFNAAAIFETESGRYVAASECGHTTLPIHSQIEQEIFDAIEAESGFPAIEDVLSGRGLERLYLFLGTKANDPKVKDAATIMASVASGNDARADECIKIFTQILGAVCGNLALTHLPFGGIYLVGGVACAMAPYLDQFGFSDAFCNKGRFAEFMRDFSVSVIEDDYAALIGCTAHLHEKMS
jgi:glucokinase